MTETAPTGSNAIINGGFVSSSNWVLGIGWVIGSGFAEKIPGNTSALRQNNILSQGLTYQVSLTANNTMGTLGVFLGANRIGTINGNGSFTFFGAALDHFFQIVPDDSSSGVVVSNISAFATDASGLKDIFVLLDCEGNYITKIVEGTTNALNYSFGAMNANLNLQSLTGSTEGVYRLGYCDPRVNACGQNGLYNGAFDIQGSTSGWAMTSNVSITSGKAVYTGVLITDTGTLDNANTKYCTGKEYNVKVVVSDLRDAFGYISIGSSTPIQLASVGTHNLVITATGVNPLLGLSFESFGTNATFQIDSIEVSLANNADYVPQILSNPLNLQQVHECTLMVNACNDSDAFGFKFEGVVFVPRIRLKARLGLAKYPFERISEHFTNGKKSTQFFEGRKDKVLRIEGVHEYAHDFLRLAAGWDHFYIEGMEYFVESDEYEVRWNRFCPQGIVELQVSEKTQLMRNTRIGVEEKDCGVSGSGGFTVDIVPVKGVDQTKGELVTDAEKLLMVRNE
jgi:hypothetical protein